MELSDAITVVRRYRPELVLQKDHICLEPSAHDLNSCRYGEAAAYTAFDALTDTTETLNARLSVDTSRLKSRLKK
jgi:hypothetical protein